MFADEYRPQTLDEVIGNEAVKYALGKYFKSDNIPHTLQFHGQTGAGKTTLARIVGRQLDAEIIEHDCGANSDINKIRSIIENSDYAPLFKVNKVIILDEVHKLSKDAQQVLLKRTEEPAKNTYFILATSEPHKLVPALRTRGISLTVEPVNIDGVREAYIRVAKQHKITLEGKADDWDKVIASADGSLREVYNILDKLVASGDKDDKGFIFVRSSDVDKLLGFVGDNYTMDETMPLPQAFMKKNLSGALEAITASKKDREPMGTMVGLYNYLKKANIKGSRAVLIDIAEILSYPERANNWYSLEFIALKHL